MISRAFGMVLVIVIGAPLLAAGVMACVPASIAMGFCFGVSAAGVIGTIAGVAQILRWDHDRPSHHAAEVDALATVVHSPVAAAGSPARPIAMLRMPLAEARNLLQPGVLIQVKHNGRASS